MAVPRLAMGDTSSTPDVSAAESALMNALYRSTAAMPSAHDTRPAGMTVRLTPRDINITDVTTRRLGNLDVSSAPAILAGTPTSATIAASVDAAIGGADP